MKITFYIYFLHTTCQVSSRKNPLNLIAVIQLLICSTLDQWTEIKNDV